MPIYKISKNTAQQLPFKREGFGNEAELRDFFAQNLEEILGVRFLEKEYPTSDGGRMDTIGIDESNSPVIIEYKWKENEEVLSQGLFYLNWLLANKKHFNLLVKSKLGSSIEVNWDHPRVILVAQGFSRYVKSAVQRVENVELKTYTLYEGDILHIENEYSTREEKEVTTKQKKSETVSIVGAYDFEKHLNTLTSEKLKKNVVTLQKLLLELPSVEEKAEQKSGVTYRTTKSFVRLEFKKTWIQVLLRDPKYTEDNKKIVKDVTTFRWGYRGMFKLTPETDAIYAFSLIKASYDSTL